MHYFDSPTFEQWLLTHGKAQAQKNDEIKVKIALVGRLSQQRFRTTYNFISSVF